jgi:CBS domain containing-hemolysin-like protein
MSLTMIVFAVFCLGLFLGGVALFFATLKMRKTPLEEASQIAGDARHAEILGILSKIPDITINKAVGTTNVERGSLGEMISFLRLKNTYDKVLPFHDVVDFIGIKFPADKEPGSLDFIKDRKINFIKMHVDVNDFTAAQDDENKS